MVAHTPRDAAQMMNDLLRERDGYLEQWRAVEELKNRFGTEFIEEVEWPGSWKIKPSVLREFRKLTPDVVWDRLDHSWMIRHDFFAPPDGRLTYDSLPPEEAIRRESKK